MEPLIIWTIIVAILTPLAFTGLTFLGFKDVYPKSRSGENKDQH